MTIITLMTDFGLKDGNVGVMKGVIAGIAPGTAVVDLSHLIGPQNIPEAALILARSAPFFPPGSIHVVIVDPGVGTRRRPMLAQIGDQYYVGPDNGTITILLEHAEQAGQAALFYELDQPQYWLAEISHVFHGRDIFAPCAAHLAGGIPPAALGSSFEQPVRLDLPRPAHLPDGWAGQVIHIDHFGNIASNIRREHLPDDAHLTVSLCGVNIHGLVKTFGERDPGALIALFGSTGNLIVSVVNGSAAQTLAAGVGDPVRVFLLIS